MVVHDGHEFQTEEEKRLKEDRHRTKYWKKWGSYLPERQWATGSSCSIAMGTPVSVSLGDRAHAKIVPMQ